jgi:hypothetical protein
MTASLLGPEALCPDPDPSTRTLPSAALPPALLPKLPTQPPTPTPTPRVDAGTRGDLGWCTREPASACTCSRETSSYPCCRRGPPPPPPLPARPAPPLTRVQAGNCCVLAGPPLAPSCTSCCRSPSPPCWPSLPSSISPSSSFGGWCGTWWSGGGGTRQYRAIPAAPAAPCRPCWRSVAGEVRTSQAHGFLAAP